MTKTFYYTVYSIVAIFNVVLKQKLCIVSNIKLDLMVDQELIRSVVIIYNKDVRCYLKIQILLLHLYF